MSENRNDQDKNRQQQGNKPQQGNKGNIEKEGQVGNDNDLDDDERITQRHDRKGMGEQGQRDMDRGGQGSDRDRNR